MNGGDQIAGALAAQGVQFLFTLCGGHIAPILVGSKRCGIRVIDTRHEATAVFAADAVARLTGRPGVAAVTAGPGLTNTITAVKNAQMAQSPVVLLGGAAPTALQGRGALQDIDQMALIRPHVKWAGKARRVRELVPMLETAFREAQEGVPGPVFLECPLDLLYDEAVVREWYGVKAGGNGLAGRLTQMYLRRHVAGIFAGAGDVGPGARAEAPSLPADPDLVRAAVERLQRAERPLVLVGSQAVRQPGTVGAVAAALAKIGAPVYLSGMARGLLGREHDLQMRHNRRRALHEADLVLAAGVPLDFRLDYGRHIPRRAFYVAANRDRRDLKRNRRPDLAALADPGLFLTALAAAMPAGERWPAWRRRLREQDQARAADILAQAGLQAVPPGDGAIVEPRSGSGAGVNPLSLLCELDSQLAPGAIVVADGGDFVGTASYIVRPTGPLAWLDPGAFGTLGVGAGFALGAKLCHPEAEVWILYGDGSVGFSLTEFDTFARHNIPVIAVVGNDARWSQIAREQVEMLHDDVGTALSYCAYHCAAEGLGAVGLRLDDSRSAAEVFGQARAAAQTGRPVLINAIIGRTDFRRGSLSM